MIDYFIILTSLMCGAIAYTLLDTYFLSQRVARLERDSSAPIADTETEIPDEPVSDREVLPECGCITCADARPNDWHPESSIPNSRTRMIVCAFCGNKRCPHATYHGNECTGSNEPGQPGSVFARCDFVSDMDRLDEAREEWRRRMSDEPVSDQFPVLKPYEGMGEGQ